MLQYLPEDIYRLLQATDDLLETECSLIVIGGTAASLAYGATKTTTDIDVATVPQEELLSALEKASAQLGLAIPVQYAGVFDPPYAYEDRLVPMQRPKLQMLKIYFPERHDLALMKMVRGYENDIQTIEEIHQSNRLDLETLLERFMEEMTQVNANPNVVRTNFILLIGRLFGSKQQVAIDKATEAWRPLQDNSD